MHRIDTNNAMNTLKVTCTNVMSTNYSTIKNVIQPISMNASPMSTNSNLAPAFTELPTSVGGDVGSGDGGDGGGGDGVGATRTNTK